MSPLAAAFRCIESPTKEEARYWLYQQRAFYPDTRPASIHLGLFKGRLVKSKVAS